MNLKNRILFYKLKKFLRLSREFPEKVLAYIVFGLGALIVLLSFLYGGMLVGFISLVIYIGFLNFPKTYLNIFSKFIFNKFVIGSFLVLVLIYILI